ncbi:MAG TPA: hypothetical protein VK595_14715 [Vicinamibacterales bacterium]|nr:hypothetical protein [Vicinamibacterales bacterium]
MPLRKPEPVADRFRRARLQAAVHNLAVAIERGECTPTRVELEALAQLCQEQWLPAEAARVRRWMDA